MSVHACDSQSSNQAVAAAAHQHTDTRVLLLSLSRLLLVCNAQKRRENTQQVSRYQTTLTLICGLLAGWCHGPLELLLWLCHLDDQIVHKCEVCCTQGLPEGCFEVITFCCAQHTVSLLLSQGLDGSGHLHGWGGVGWVGQGQEDRHAESEQVSE